MSDTITISCNLNKAQYKALSTYINDDENGIQTYFCNWIITKANDLINNIFQSEIDRLITKGENIIGSKNEIILNAQLKTASELNKIAKTNEKLIFEK